MHIAEIDTTVMSFHSDQYNEKNMLYELYGFSIKLPKFAIFCNYSK